jgi:hypothetical protein
MPQSLLVRREIFDYERFREMLLYVLICVALALAGVAGLQFFYLAYLERLNKQQKRRIYELERHNTALHNRWQEAERQLATFRIQHEEEILEEDEAWAEYIEDDVIR